MALFVVSVIYILLIMLSVFFSPVMRVFFVNTCCFFLDVLGSGLWQEGFRSLTSPHLVDLARDLPNVVMLGKPPSTLNKYRLAWLSWKHWAG